MKKKGGYIMITLITFYIILNIAGFILMMDLHYLLHKAFYKEFIIAWKQAKILIKLALVLAVLFIFIPAVIITRIIL